MVRIRHKAGHLATALALLMPVAAMPAADTAQWNQPHKPFRIYGNTYYVGTAGLSSVLVTSEYGHVLIDGGLPESAAQIAANIQALGFDLKEVKAILNSHAHGDHAGGIAELQRLTGAQVFVLRPAQSVLQTGKLPKDDPQYSSRASGIPPVANVWVVQDDQLLGVGNVRLRVLATPGHTPGGTTWTWDACEGSRCLAFVYADSLAAVSSGKYRFRDHPEVLQAFEGSFARLESTRCELLLTPHPEAGRLQALEQAGGKPESLADEGACKRYAKQGREGLQKRLADES